MLRIYTLVVSMVFSSCVSTLSFDSVESEDRNITLSRSTGHKSINWFGGSVDDAFNKAKNNDRFVLLVLENTLDTESYLNKSMLFPDKNFVKLTQITMPLLVDFKSKNGKLIAETFDLNNNFGIFLISPNKKHVFPINSNQPMNTMKFSVKKLIEGYDFKEDSFPKFSQKIDEKIESGVLPVFRINRDLSFTTSIISIQNKIKEFDRLKNIEKRSSLAISLMEDLQLWGNLREYRNNKRLIKLYKRWPDFVSVLLESPETVELSAPFLVIERHRILSGFLSWARMIEYKERMIEAMIYISEDKKTSPPLKLIALKSAIELDMMYRELDGGSEYEEFLSNYLDKNEVNYQNKTDINASIYEIHAALLEKMQFDDAAKLYKNYSAKIELPFKIYQNYFMYFRNKSNVNQARKWNRIAIKYSKNLEFTIEQTKLYLEFLKTRKSRFFKVDYPHYISHSFSLLKMNSQYLSSAEFKTRVGQLISVTDDLGGNKKRDIEKIIGDFKSFCNAVDKRLRDICLKEFKL